MSVSRFAAACVVAFVASGVVQAQSLGEIAKQAATAKAARASAGQDPAPRKVLTTADLVADTLAKAPLSAEAQAAHDAAVLARAAEAAKDPAVLALLAVPVRGEAYWRGRLDALVAKLARDQEAAARVDRRLTAVSGNLEPNLPSLAVFGPEVVRLTTELTEWNAILTADRAAITALKEEGRQAGAFPGWFR